MIVELSTCFEDQLCRVLKKLFQQSWVLITMQSLICCTLYVLQGLHGNVFKCLDIVACIILIAILQLHFVIIVEYICNELGMYGTYALTWGKCWKYQWKVSSMFILVIPQSEVVFVMVKRIFCCQDFVYMELPFIFWVTFLIYDPSLKLSISTSKPVL